MTDALSIPGTDMAGADPIMRTILQRGAAGTADGARMESEFKASQGREAAARTAQATALAPVRAKEKAVLEAGAPPVPQEKPMPEAPKAPHVDQEQMYQVLTLVAMLAASGGALTRAPLTAALNNFAAGVDGFQKGQADSFSKSLKEFEANVKKANAENESIWKKYKAARDKYGTDIAGLQNEMKIIAAETQSPIDVELATRGDLVSLAKLHETQNNNYMKALESIARIKSTHDEHEANAAYRRDSLAERTRHDKSVEGRTAHGKAPPTQNELAKDFQKEALALHRGYVKAWNKGGAEERAQLTQQYKGELEALRANYMSRGFTGKLSDVGAPPAAAPAKAAAGQPPSFATEAEAAAANLAPGTKVVIGGKSGTWQ